jgi:EAL domain-containing protein (putative c-di-GMP-specific phosphodiesterase class I)/DNA-binding NarL/FixJ family response regulator
VTKVAPIRVIVADDDANVREALAALILDHDGFTLVGAVASADAAIELAARATADVAVVDVRMPGGGARAARGLKQASPATRVLALSAHDDRATVLEMLEAGAVGYLVKGSPVETILESIARAATGQASLSGEVTGEVIGELVGQLGVRRRAQKRKRARVRRIRRALEDGGLQIVFQNICLLTGSAVGVEALARFRGPPKRPPDQWFAEAGEVGLRREVELAAVQAALNELPEIPVDLFLSINVSPSTLADDGFLELLAETGGARVVVEVTEHARIDDYEGLNEALARVRALGARVAVDDAGAGFASLRHILRLAPSFIKLDRTLIDGIEHDRSQQALAVGLISFAEQIGATIIAEGVEQAAEVEALTSLGVRYGQGFYFCRPAPLPVLSSFSTIVRTR